MEKQGFIIKGVAGTFIVETTSGVYSCTPRGVFRKRGTTPLVGDNVEITVTSEEKMLGTLHTIKPRDNKLVRPPAANIGQVIITVAVAQPSFHAGLLDRFLALVEYENIPILICVNKNDLKVSDEFLPYEMAGYPIIYTSTLQGNGLDLLREEMAGKLNLFAGPSGVGKSSLINALAGLQLETGGLSLKLDRGKHTTRHTEIFKLGDKKEDGYCFDTSGFSSLDLTHIQKNELAFCFKEFRPFINECKFSNCLHNKEIGCAVKENVGAVIHLLRYEGYLKLLDLLN